LCNLEQYDTIYDYANKRMNKSDSSRQNILQEFTMNTYDLNETKSETDKQKDKQKELER